jgi:vancomycin resistance protein YoaR
MGEVEHADRVGQADRVTCASPSGAASTLGAIMATSTAVRRDAPPRSRVRRGLLRAAVVAAVLLLACAALLAAFRLTRDGMLPGATLAGAELGGATEEELRAAVQAYGAERAADTVTVRRDDAHLQADASELGYGLSVNDTTARAWGRGRQTNPLAALRDHVRASVGAATRIAPVERVNDAVLTRWTHEAARALELAPLEGSVTLEGGRVQRTDPQDGARVVVESLERDLRAAVLAVGSEELDAPTEPLSPRTTVADVDAAVSEAERAVAGPVTLSRDDATLTLSPEDIGEILGFELDPDADEGSRLVATADPDALVEIAGGATVDAFEVDPVDARFRVSGETVEIVDSQAGFEFDAELAAEQVRTVATRASVEAGREVELQGRIVEPERSTADAEALEIVERVSTFTTNHACCQGRVQNIQRFADLVDGVVVEPGEDLSLNDHVGPRTREKGFTEDAAIIDGEYVDRVGGGVSQFATTFYNAAYFGGYELVDFKAHSYYIARYPMGREATISYPTVDLRIRNSSPHGLLVKTSYTPTSITVSFYGTEWVEVESRTGSPRNFTSGQTTYRSAPDLGPGQERVVQSGGEGFDITDVRVLTYPDGRVEREEIFTRYLPERRIVERGSG